MVDIIVVGSGIAGLTASIHASDNGARVSLISPDYSERSQSVMAMGGINAALDTKGENDSVKEHFTDTINGGCEINNRKAVEMLTRDAPGIIDWLSRIGTSFTRDANGSVDLRNFGGQKKKRTAYAGSRTGKQIVSALVNACRKRESEGKIKRFVGYRFLSLIFTDKNECCGVNCIHEDTQEIKSFTGDAVIIATGGYNQLFGKILGSVQNDGFATAKLFTQGVELANLEMVQYHPTTVSTSLKRMLITEAARGEGGRLFVERDGQRHYFMKEMYPELADLMPRDVVSRSIYNVSDGGKREVFLDLTHLDEDTVKIRLDEVWEICNRYLNLNPLESPIPVFPAPHYFMGGILTDENHRTNIKGLYAAGECSCQYHGANRLGGNSLLGAVHGGLICAQNAVLEKVEGNPVTAVDDEVDLYVNGDESLSHALGEISDIMNESMGIYRNEEGLKKGLERLNDLDTNVNAKYYDCQKVRLLKILAKASILSALSRKESRGAHQRTDYPQSDKNYEKATFVTYENGKIVIR
ncbi:MAG: FAD-binding protein [Methanobrevibacter sp.]|uniref:FAD-binding protein n=1 Tax=Methanobrevibacter sp. TaxID=66852 RepID=UPI0025D7EB49|nr:FAD-binding protein [Methanobrevibacter sp.]MBR0270692.1 FAD-binding protein [Methanobrevibacter sp.]